MNIPNKKFFKTIFKNTFYSSRWIIQFVKLEYHKYEWYWKKFYKFDPKLDYFKTWLY